MAAPGHRASIGRAHGVVRILRGHEGDDPEGGPTRSEQHSPLTASTVLLLVHERAPIPSQSTLDAGADIDHLDVRHPLEGEVGMLRASLSEPDDRRCLLFIRSSCHREFSLVVRMRE